MVDSLHSNKLESKGDAMGWVNYACQTKLRSGISIGGRSEAPTDAV